MGNGRKHGSPGPKPATPQQDKLSTKERQQIEQKLGISADLGGDAYGNDAYLLLEVPDFGEPGFPNTDNALFPSQIHQPSGATEPARRLQSFLRLGAFDINREPATAKKLLKALYAAGPPGYPGRGDYNAGALKDAVDAAETQASTDGVPLDLNNLPSFETALAALKTRADGGQGDDAGNRDVFFVDDVRYRPGDVTHCPATKDATTEADDPGHGLNMTARQAESAKLYARGGWRDHSDGNRISTTYGDKVEIVRGNYKMVIMGRQDDPGEAMGWEATGSHIQDFAPGTMPGASYWLQWIPDYQNIDGSKGVWLLANTTENVYEYARNAGNFREEVWGDVHETYVGSENPTTGQGVTAAEAAAHKGTQGHKPPHTFSDRQYHLPGSGEDDRATPSWNDDNEGMVRSNPHIIEGTWAKRIDSWTGSPACPVEDIREAVDCSGAIWSTTHAGATNDRAAVGAMADSTITSHIAETLVCGSRLATTAMLVLDTDLKYALAELEVKLILGLTTAIQIASTTAEIGVTTINDFEFKYHGAAETIDIVLTKHTDVALYAQKSETEMGKKEVFFVGTENEVKVGKFDSVEFPGETKTEVTKEEKAANRKVTTMDLDLTSLKTALKAPKMDFN